MNLAKLPKLGAITALFTVVACGGTAVIDGPLGGAGGSGGTGSGTATGTGTPTGTGGTGPGGPVEQACLRFCDAVAACAAYPNCVGECMADVSPQCAALYVELLDCATETMGPPTCELPPECEQRLIAWSSCEDGIEPPPPPPCGPMGCGVSSDGSCTCQVDCAEASYQVDCTPAGATNSCTCKMDGLPVGYCSEAFGGQPCEPFTGCCADVFFGLD